MSQAVTIALVGDFNEAVTAHRAIPLALKMAATDLGVPIRGDWLHTSKLGTNPQNKLANYHGIWCVPASPYADTEAAIAAIRFAREQRRPFLGTCGGFQHALLEYARNVLSQMTAQHAELDPAAANPLIAPLACALVEKSGSISLVAESRLAAAYGTTEIVEGYHCNYGLSPSFEKLFEGSALRVVGRDQQGEVRAVECEGHPFYVATLFQPERAALRGKLPPVVRAFANAAMSTVIQPANVM